MSFSLEWNIAILYFVIISMIGKCPYNSCKHVSSLVMKDEEMTGQCIDPNRERTPTTSLVSANHRYLSEEFVRLFADTNYVHVAYKHDYHHAYHSVRKVYSFSWVNVDASVRAGGHRFCSFIRDNYACYGRNYVRVLRNTAPINARSVSLGQLKPNSFVFIQGNSYLAEVIYYWTCYDDDTHVWMLKGDTNSIFAYHIRTRSAVLLIDNDEELERNTSKLICNLQRIALSPSVMLVGNVNSYGSRVESRIHLFIRAFPDAIALEMVENQFLPRNCTANTCNVVLDANPDGNVSLHQCIPGPMVGVVEDIHKKLVDASYAYAAGKRSTGIIYLPNYKEH